MLIRMEERMLTRSGIQDMAMFIGIINRIEENYKRIENNMRKEFRNLRTEMKKKM